MEENQFQINPLSKESDTFRQNQMRRVIWGLMAVAGIFVVFVLSWFLWNRSPAYSDKNIELAIEASEEIASGEKVNYVVKLYNRNSQSLEETRLVFFYPPDSLVIKDEKPVQSLTEEVKIGKVLPGEQSQYEFPAYLVGDRGETKRASAKLIFTPQEVRSSFEKEAEAITNIRSLDMALTLVAPPNAVSGQSISYILDYRNEAGEELSNLTVEFSYPDGFTPTRFNPAPVASNQRWEIKFIKPGEGNRIVVEGVIRGSERESKKVRVVLQRLADGITIDYQRSVSATVISTPLLGAEVMINNQAGPYTAKLGEVLDYKIKFTNNSEVDLTGLTIAVKLDGSMFDFGTMRTNGFFDAGAKTVIWNAASSPLLNRLAPGQYGEVDFAIGLKNSFPFSGLGAKDLVVKASVVAETLTIPPGFFGDVLTARAETATKIKSLPSFEQTAFYSSGGLEGSGPVPPKAGSKTVYTIIWRMSNTAGDIMKTKMKGVLPVGASWENRVKVSGQQALPTFKNSSREVIWDVGVLPAGTGSILPRYEAWFQVSITPSDSQVGTIPILINNFRLEGEDGTTREVLVLKGGNIDANSLEDQPNQGVVGE